MSTRLSRDAAGRLVAIVTAPGVGQSVGVVYVVHGNEPDTGGRSWAFMGRPTARIGVPDTVRVLRQGRAGVIPRDYPPGTRERALQLRADGLSCSQVAAKVGAPTSTVKFWAQRAKRAA